MSQTDDKSDSAVRVGVQELRGNLTHYLRESGKDTSNNTVMSELRAPQTDARPPRQTGALCGQIVLAEDFDTLPEDVLAAMEE